MFPWDVKQSPIYKAGPNNEAMNSLLSKVTSNGSGLLFYQ